jgi:hypothetical protein
MSRLTGQSFDHEKPSCELPGAVSPVSLTTKLVEGQGLFIFV